MSTSSNIRLWGLFYGALIAMSIAIESYIAAAFLFYYGIALMLADIVKILESATNRKQSG